MGVTGALDRIADRLGGLVRHKGLPDGTDWPGLPKAMPGVGPVNIGDVTTEVHNMQLFTLRVFECEVSNGPYSNVRCGSQVLELRRNRDF
jgi:hypothetical protein